MSATPFRRTIRIRSVTRAYRAGAGSCIAQVSALDEATLEIRGGEVVIIAGPTGSGKTTLLLCAAGLLRCDSGMIDVGLRVLYRDLSRPRKESDERPADAAIFLDSVDRALPATLDRLSSEVDAALSDRNAVVLAGRDPSRCLSLVPADATISIVHMRLGRLVPPGVAAFHRVAEGTGALRRG